MALRLRPDRKPRVCVDFTPAMQALRQAEAGFDRIDRKIRATQAGSAMCVNHCFWLYAAVVAAAVAAKALL